MGWRLHLDQVRHTRRTEMIEQRSPLHVVQQALGHVDPRSTPLYAAMSDLQFRHDVERHQR
jgi:site-specific recombinase XerD